jgi:cytidylate kinase
MGSKRNVIAISRAMGAGGEEIGRIVASELGLRYADEEIIVQAAEKAGVSPETIAKTESSPGLIERILNAVGTLPPPVEMSALVPVVTEAPPAYDGLIEDVIKETAAQGNVVIVGHAASIPLAGSSGLLRVLVTAPEVLRTQRLADTQGLGMDKAKKAIRHSDGERRRYLERFHGLAEERPDHYDLVVNTDRLSFEEAAHIIATAAG